MLKRSSPSPYSAPFPAWAGALLGVYAVTFACAGAKPPFAFRGPAPENAHDRAMGLFAERYLDSSLELSPITASYVGYHRWDHLLPDWSPEGLAKAKTRLLGLKAELAKIDRKKLSLSYTIDHQLIEERLAAELYTLETLQPHRWDVQSYNEVIGGGFYYLSIPPADPKDWPKRLEALLGRLQALPRFLKQAETNLVAPPRVFVDFVKGQQAGNLSTLTDSLPKLFEPYPALQARFQKLQPQAISALQNFGKFLDEDLSQRATGDWRLGKERWEAKLKHTLQSPISAQDLLAGATLSLDQVRFEMYDLALPLYRQLFPGDESYQTLVGDARINHVVGKVIAAASVEHGTAESFFADVAQTAEKAKQFIQKSNLIALPPATDNFAIEPTPAFLDGLAVAFYNPAPAFEPDLKKSYWISSVPKAGTEDGESYLREYNAYIMQALTIHEAFPGHYVQLYWSSHSPYASIVKAVLESGTMAEGWAVMIEQLMHEAGYAEGDPKNRLFHLKMRLRVFINAIIDARLHTSGEEESVLDAWALDLMMTKGFQEKAEATRKLRRAKLTSTQLSTYYVGYREMLDLYRRGQQKGGKNFEKRSFLEKMIGYGTIPPAMIERLLVSDGLIDQGSTGN